MKWNGMKKNKQWKREEQTNSPHQGAKSSAASLSSTPTQLSLWRSWVEWRERGRQWVFVWGVIGGCKPQATSPKERQAPPITLLLFLLIHQSLFCSQYILSSGMKRIDWNEVKSMSGMNERVSPKRRLSGRAEQTIKQTNWVSLVGLFVKRVG